MKGSRRSDRELAKALRVSQPTMIPDFSKLGVEIVAITFGQWSAEKINEYS
jgi:hypothetical protein